MMHIPNLFPEPGTSTTFERAWALFLLAASVVLWRYTLRLLKARPKEPKQ